jgi:hypothetical protein
MKLLNPLPQRLDTGATPTFAGLLAGDGTAAAPSISFAADTDTVFYRRAANTVGVSVGGQAILSIYDLGSNNLVLQNPLGASLGYININGVGAVGLTAGGTNQNITLTPSGTGNVVTTSNRNGALKYALTNADGGTAAYTATELSNGSDVGVLYQFGTAWTTSGRFIQASTLLDSSASGGLTLAVSGGTPIRFWSGAELARFAPNTGRFLIGTTTDSVNGILQLATHTTSAGGIGFGTDTTLYTEQVGRIILAKNTAGDCTFRWAAGGTVYGYLGQSGGNSILGTLSGTLVLQTSALTALTLDSSQNATFAGTVKPQLATTAGAPAYVKGAIYFDTTLNKLRVGGATAWETITSV